MTKRDTKKNESQIEEIDLSMISPDGIFDLKKIRETPVESIKKNTSSYKKEDDHDEDIESADIEPEIILSDDADILKEDEDDMIFDEDFLVLDDFDEDDDLDEEDEDGEDDGKKKKKKDRGLKKIPVERSEDKRRVGK